MRPNWQGGSWQAEHEETVPVERAGRTWSCGHGPEVAGPTGLASRPPLRTHDHGHHTLWLFGAEFLSALSPAGALKNGDPGAVGRPSLGTR
jgi:hypothetical protein